MYAAFCVLYQLIVPRLPRTFAQWLLLFDAVAAVVLASMLVWGLAEDLS